MFYAEQNQSRIWVYDMNTRKTSHVSPTKQSTTQPWGAYFMGYTVYQVVHKDIQC